MDTLADKIAASGAIQDHRRKDHERLCQIAAEIFATNNGRELLEHLVKRFDLLGRVFIATDRGEVNALRAAVRDGERSAVNHLISLIRTAKPDFSIPL